MKKENNTVSLNYRYLLSVILLFCIIIGKLIYVSASKKVDGIDIKTYAANRNSTTDKLTASRGTIYSTNGETLAKDVNSYTLIAYIDPARTTNPKYPNHVVEKEYTANVLSEHINASAEYILGRLSLKGYQVQFGTAGANLSEKEKQEIDALDLPGIDFIASTKRYYPFGDFAPYIIGYAKKYDDGRIVGELGVESYYNKELTGTDGYSTYQQDAYGYQIADTPVITVDAKSGNDIYLTIDSNVQMYLENTLENMSNNYNYEWATVTVANAKTGAILGSASTPSFDPNKLNIKDYNAPLVSYTYEPGSTMKIFSFMAAMEEGIYNGSDKFASGTKKIGEYTIKDWNNVGWGTISYDTGFTYSSNIAAANLAQKLGRKTIIDYYRNFGFASKTGIEMANEYAGVLKIDSDITLANVAFGQGLTTTPIQNVQALTALANSGTILKPYIVEKIVDHDTKEVLYESERTEIRKVVSENTVNEMLELMYLTVNNSDTIATGTGYKTESTTLIGKTGTAQIASSRGGYLTGDYNNIRSFAGLFPYEDPEFIIYMSVKKLEGTSRALSSQVKSIVESIAKYKNLDQLVVSQDKSKIIDVKNYINKDYSEVEDELDGLGLKVVKIGSGNRIINQYPEKGSTAIKDSKLFIQTNSVNVVMPNMVGWTSSEVSTYCNLVGLTCNTEGYGKVMSQSIDEGEPIGQTTILDVVLSREGT